MVLKRLVLLLAVFGIWSTQLRAELMIEITKGSDSALPIAVVPFENRTKTALPDDMQMVIANDLQRSGDFNTLPTSRMLSLPSSSDQVYYRDWRLLGQSYVLVGYVKYLPQNDKYEVGYELMDVIGQKRLLGEILTGDKSSFRALAHYISDAVYEKITGIRGIFSTKIAFITYNVLNGGKKEYRLQIADADGKNAQTLYKSNEPIMSPAWSRDGKKLAYSAFHNRRPAIYVQDLATGKRQKVAAYRGLNSAPDWSPDGKSLIVTLSKDSSADLYRLDLASRNLERLTTQPDIDTEASWNPVNPNQIVFTSDRSGSPQVYKMNLTDKVPVRVTFDGSYNARPRFSYDGKEIYFVHRVNGDFHIASLNLKTGEQRVLTSTPLDESPSVAPNGQMLIYVKRRRGKGVLAVISVDKKSNYFLPSDQGDVKEPVWSPYLR
jgi:TolB protein